MRILNNIKSGVASAALVASIAAAGVSFIPEAAMAQASSREARTLTMSVGRGQQFNLPRAITDVTIADPDVVDVQVTTAKQVYILAKAPGETTVYATDASGGTVMVINVRVGNNVDSIDQMLKLAMPDADIAITYMNGVALLTGTVKQPEDAAEAERLVEAFMSGSGSGGGAEPKIVSRIKVATPLQVNLQVRIAEVNRSLAKEMNNNLQTVDRNGSSFFGIARGRDFIDDEGKINYAENENQLTVIGKLFGIDVSAAFEAAETSGLASTLATPNLTTISGETGNFQAGGSFPVVAVSQNSGTDIEYKDYGVLLSYTPTVLNDGRISLRVSTEVSDITTQGAIRIGGLEVPALTKRNVETSVELGSGQSIMIAGLMQNNLQNSVEKFPFLGDIPVLGTLFKSKGWRKNETELVIVITPYLVKPVNANDIRLPTDGFNSPNDAERILLNKQTSQRGPSGPTRPSVIDATPSKPEFSSTNGSTNDGAAAATALPAPGPDQVQASASGPGFSFDQ